MKVMEGRLASGLTETADLHKKNIAASTRAIGNALRRSPVRRGAAEVEGDVRHRDRWQCRTRSPGKQHRVGGDLQRSSRHRQLHRCQAGIDGGQRRGRAPAGSTTDMKPPDQSSQFSSVLERTMMVLEAENDALREKRLVHFGDLHARKAMALFELERLGSLPATQSNRLRHRLELLRDLLGENRALLGLHIRALAEVVDALQVHQIGVDSDGTYSARSVIGGGR